MPWSDRSRRRLELPSGWASIRREVIARDGGRCVLCGAPGTDVDHVVRGSDHSLGNLRLLCRACHMRRTGRDGGRTSRKPRPRPWRRPESPPGYLPEFRK